MVYHGILNRDPCFSWYFKRSLHSWSWYAWLEEFNPGSEDRVCRIFKSKNFRVCGTFAQTKLTGRLGTWHSKNALSNPGLNGSNNTYYGSIQSSGSGLNTLSHVRLAKIAAGALVWYRHFPYVQELCEAVVWWCLNMWAILCYNTEKPEYCCHELGGKSESPAVSIGSNKRKEPRFSYE